MLQDQGSDHLPILLSIPLSLRSFAPTSVLLPSTFRKLAGMTLSPTLTLTVLLQRNTRHFLFPLLLPNCSSPRESASVYVDYLRSHFSVSQPKTLRSRSRGYLYELRRATCPEESDSSFCFPFSPAEGCL